MSRSGTVKRATFILALAVGFVAMPMARAQVQHPEEKTASNAVERKEVVQEQESETEAYRHSAAVQKVGHMLGLQPEGAARLFEFINFAVLGIAIVWFLVKRMPGVLRARGEKIARDLTEARTVTEDANTRLSGVEQRLAKLDQDIAAIRAQAEADAQREEARMKAELESEKNRIIAAAEQEITSAGAHAQRDLKQYAAALAIEHAARSLNLTPENDRNLVENFAASLGGKRGQN